MNKQKLNIWGREFELDIVFDCYEGEEVLPAQKDALEKFLSSATRLIDGAKQSVEEYCVKRNADEIGSLPIANIFKYVKPKSLYIQRTANGSRTVGLMCAYKYDMENGIVVIFKDEVFFIVGTQNTIL